MSRRGPTYYVQRYTTSVGEVVIAHEMSAAREDQPRLETPTAPPAERRAGRAAIDQAGPAAAARARAGARRGAADQAGPSNATARAGTKRAREDHAGPPTAAKRARPGASAAADDASNAGLDPAAVTQRALKLFDQDKRKQVEREEPKLRRREVTAKVREAWRNRTAKRERQYMDKARAQLRQEREAADRKGKRPAAAAAAWR